LQIIITLTSQTSHSTLLYSLGPTDNSLALGDCRQRSLDAAFLRRWLFWPWKSSLPVQFVILITAEPMTSTFLATRNTALDLFDPCRLI
jgi:hypothetical protein